MAQVYIAYSCDLGVFLNVFVILLDSCIVQNMAVDYSRLLTEGPFSHRTCVVSVAVYNDD